ncbi:hect-domain-containing protein [Sesbania bispinosa]|nr:hect-domain-containing protein [Sesbania bispinosa]
MTLQCPWLTQMPPGIAQELGFPPAPSLESIVAGDVLFRKKASGNEVDEEAGPRKETNVNQEQGHNSATMSERTSTTAAEKAKACLPGANTVGSVSNEVVLNQMSDEVEKGK